MLHNTHLHIDNIDILRFRGIEDMMTDDIFSYLWNSISIPSANCVACRVLEGRVATKDKIICVKDK